MRYAGVRATRRGSKTLEEIFEHSHRTGLQQNPQTSTWPPLEASWRAVVGRLVCALPPMTTTSTGLGVFSTAVGCRHILFHEAHASCYDAFFALLTPTSIPATLELRASRQHVPESSTSPLFAARTRPCQPPPRRGRDFSPKRPAPGLSGLRSLRRPCPPRAASFVKAPYEHMSAHVDLLQLFNDAMSGSNLNFNPSLF